MTIVVELADDPDLTGWTELTEIKLETLRCGGIANKTEVGTGGGFDWYDDAGVKVLPGRRPIRVIETATVPDTTLFRGRVSVKGIGRGVIVQEDAKQFGVALDDYNQDLRGIVVNAWVRPEETDVARVTALWNAYLRGATSTSSRARVSTDLDDAYIASSPTVLLPAERYDLTDPAGVLSAICDTTGKEAFVTVDGELFYDTPTSTAYASTYDITDDNPDMTDELPPIWEGDAATEDPTELLSGAFAKYGFGSGSVTESRPAVEALFDKWEQAVQFDLNSAANAALQLDALLDNQGIEEKSRRCSIEIPPDQVDRIKWGQTISYRAAASGDLTPVTLRISYLLWEVPISPEAPYIAHLELVKPKKIARRVKGTNGPSPVAIRNGLEEQNQALYPYCVLTYQRETFTRTVTGGLGNSEFDGGPAWGTAGAGATFDVNGTQAVMIADPVIPARAAVALGFSGVLEILWNWTLDDSSADSFAQCRFALYDSTDLVFSCDITQVPTGTTAVFTLYSGGVSDAQFSVIDNTIILGETFWCRMLVNGLVLSGSIDTAPPSGSAWDGTDTAAGPIDDPNILDMMVDDGDTLFVNDIAVLQGLPFACLSIGSFSAAPVPGQEIEEDLGFGDGSNVSFTLDFPAAPGTLHVDVDGTDQTDAVVYSVGDIFYLSFAPLASEHITVTYRRADA